MLFSKSLFRRYPVFLHYYLAVVSYTTLNNCKSKSIYCAGMNMINEMYKKEMKNDKWKKLVSITKRYQGSFSSGKTFSLWFDIVVHGSLPCNGQFRIIFELEGTLIKGKAN